jgi:transposase
MTEPRPAKTYTPEFRESAVPLAVTSNCPIAPTTQELGLSKDTWYGWVRQAKAQRSVAHAPAPTDPVQEEWKHRSPVEFEQRQQKAA